MMRFNIRGSLVAPASRTLFLNFINKIAVTYLYNVVQFSESGFKASSRVDE